MTDNQFGLAARSKSFETIIENTTYTNIKGEIKDIEEAYTHFINLLITHRAGNGMVFLIGNGGSAAVVSHILTDFINVCRLRVSALHDPALITCMSNDYGYDNAFKQVLNTVFRKEDLLIAISSSGKSPNICNAANVVRAHGGKVITFTGFSGDNALRKLGDMNFWLDSCDYGLVEIGHLFLLHNLADRIAHLLKLNEQKKTLPQKEQESCTTELL
jgi:D-sedoheptulose 7-phosphate isomerase